MDFNPVWLTVALAGMGTVALIVIMVMRLSSLRKPVVQVPHVNPEFVEPPTKPRVMPTKLLQARLTIKNGTKRGQHYDIKSNDISIGRGHSNQVKLDDPTVSRTHAGIYRDKDGFVIYDKGASQGLLVNGQDISGASAMLSDDSVIQMGETMMQFNVIEVPV